MSTQVSTPKTPENPSTLSTLNQILALLGIEISEIDLQGERFQSVFDRMQFKNERDMHRFKEAIGHQPKATRLLNQFLDPELEYEEAFDLLQELNETFGPIGKRHGRSSSAILNLPHGRSLTIHLFPEMDHALSADMDWHA